MATFRIKPESLKAVQANIDKALVTKKKQVGMAMSNWALDVKTAISRELNAIGAVDTHILEGATYVTPVTQIGTRSKISIINPMEYAVIVEFGRRAGGKWPPVSAILGWAVRHGLVTTLTVNADIFGQYAKEWETAVAITSALWISKAGGGKNKKSEAINPVVRDLVTLRLIQKKIGMYGTEGRHPFSIVWDQKEQNL